MLFLSAGLTVYVLSLTALLGLVAGSFCNAWAWRLAHHESIARGRSHCAVCGHSLSARDLIPLASYLALRGKCRYCGAPISRRYPIAEAVMALYFLSVVLRYDFTSPFTTLRWLFLGCVLFTVALVDWDTREIPDRLHILGTLLFLLRGAQEGLSGICSGLLGSAAVFIPLFVLVLIADKVLGRESMGGGDLKLLGVLGLHFGLALTVLLLILSCITGLVMGFLLKHTKSKDAGLIPFGTAVALSSWPVILFGSPLLSWYLSLFSL